MRLFIKDREEELTPRVFSFYFLFHITNFFEASHSESKLEKYCKITPSPIIPNGSNISSSNTFIPVMSLTSCK